jgi:hypothetical protein
MSPFLGFAAMSALIAWLVRRPSSELFEEADSYYAAAEHWQQRLRDPQYLMEVGDYVRRRNACLQAAAALTRKALRRMPWKLL